MVRNPRGFTLVEALIAMAIACVLLGVAVPASSAALEAAHAGAARAALFGTLMQSIRHATLAGSEVVMCPGDAGGCRDSNDWSDGWIAFADIDGNRHRGANETLLDVAPALSGKVHLRSTRGRTRLVFQPNGGNAGSNVTFTLCDGRGPGQASTLVLSNTGRLRSSTPTAAAAQACLQPM
jgi:type IV fimbrial biogenesis protein FimT